jgi:hypothetical protein
MHTSLLHPALSTLAMFQGTQLSLFERFLNQAVSGINSTSITSGMQQVSYVVLLVGFLWQVYQSAMHGGDVKGLGTSLLKYVVTAIVVMNYGSIFTTVNQGFVNSGNWISNASGASNLFQNWATDLQTQFNQTGSQKMWGLITGDLPGLLDAILIIVAYLLYPIVIVIFGFFYIFYGSVLYIFGPLVIGLMPLGATNRIAKAYVQNLFIWNSWPILYGGFGALLSAVQMGQIGQMLSQNNFLGGLGNMEGAFLIGIASCVYSLAIAVIPFIAYKLVTGDVGSTAAAIIGTAATALTAGAAAFEGAALGAGAGAAASGGAAAGSGTSSGTAHAGASATSRAGNSPVSPQPVPASIGASPMAAAHADDMRASFSEAMGSGPDATHGSGEGTDSPGTSSSAGAVGSPGLAGSGSRPANAGRRGPTLHRYNLGSVAAFHAARVAAATVAKATRLSSEPRRTS